MKRFFCLVPKTESTELQRALLVKIHRASPADSSAFLVRTRPRAFFSLSWGRTHNIAIRPRRKTSYFELRKSKFMVGIVQTKVYSTCLDDLNTLVKEKRQTQPWFPKYCRKSDFIGRHFGQGRNHIEFSALSRRFIRTCLVDGADQHMFLEVIRHEKIDDGLSFTFRLRFGGENGHFPKLALQRHSNTWWKNVELDCLLENKTRNVPMRDNFTINKHVSVSQLSISLFVTYHRSFIGVANVRIGIGVDISIGVITDLPR